MSGTFRSRLLPLLLGAGILGPAAFAQPPPAAPAPAPAPKPMAWEERRAGYFQLLHSLQARDPNAAKIFGAVLTDFEQRPMSRTPMENMDILGTAFAAKEPPGQLVPVVVMNAALGWYDAIRFGSPSGRDEIANQEKFFVRAFSMAGPEVQQREIAFLKGAPEPVAAAVEHGLELAAKLKDTDRYDRTWPTAYGQERRTGALVPPPLSPERWPAAWEGVIAKIRSYYEDAAQPPPTGTLAPGGRADTNSRVK